MAKLFMQVYAPAAEPLQDFIPLILLGSFVILIVWMFRKALKNRRKNRNQNNQDNLHLKNIQLQYENKILQLEKENIELRRKTEAPSN